MNGTLVSIAAYRGTKLLRAVHVGVGSEDFKLLPHKRMRSQY